jgi:hypothetical protein
MSESLLLAWVLKSHVLLVEPVRDTLCYLHSFKSLALCDTLVVLGCHRVSNQPDRCPTGQRGTYYILSHLLDLVHTYALILRSRSVLPSEVP